MKGKEGDLGGDRTHLLAADLLPADLHLVGLLEAEEMAGHPTPLPLLALCVLEARCGNTSG